MPFKNTKWDYIILIGGIVVFCHAFFTIKYLPVYSINNEYVIGYSIQVGLQYFIAPLIVLHRFYLLYLCEKGDVKTLRERNIKLSLKLWRYNKIMWIKSEFGRLSKKQFYLSMVLWLIWFIIGFYILMLKLN